MFRDATTLLIFATCAAHAVTFEWDHSPDPTVVGYRLYWGRSPGVYDSSVMVAKTNAVTVANPAPGVTNFYTVTARNAAGIESLPSNEVQYPASTNSPLPSVTGYRVKP